MTIAGRAAHATETTMNDRQPTQSRFANGTRIASLRTPLQGGVAFGVWVLSGSRFEAKGQWGFAHFLEHLAFKGTDRYSATELSRDFESMGGMINAHTGRELTAFHGWVPRSALAELAQRLISMVLEPALHDADVRLEREVIFQEMSAVQDDPADWINEVAVQHAWGEHPMALPILGDRQSLNGVTAPTLRAYMRSTLTGPRICIVVVGNVEHGLVERLGTRLAALPAAAFTSPPAPTFAAGVHRAEKRMEQSQLVWLAETRGAADPHWSMQRLANHIIGGGTSSRLFQHLRERLGLVYDVDSYTDGYADCGFWAIQTACQPEHTAACEAAVQEVMETLLRDGVTDDELDLARRHLEARLDLARDDPEASLEWLAKRCFYGDGYADPENIRRALRKATVDDVNRAIAAWANPCQVVWQARDPGD